MNIKLVRPVHVSDYWYKAKIMADKNSMKYNAGYDLNNENYDYNTGIIKYEREKWGIEFIRNRSKAYYFAYIYDIDLDCYVGYVDYHRGTYCYNCGVVVEYAYRHRGYGKKALELLIEQAKKDGIKEMYDSFEEDRGCLPIFEQFGFEVVERTTWKKFGQDVSGLIVKIDLMENKDE